MEQTIFPSQTPINSSVEQWKDIPSYEGLYQVSTHGHVKSLARMIMGRGGWPQPWAERILRPDVSKTGHLYVRLCHSGHSKKYAIHRLVLLTFIGSPPSHQQETRHYDGDPQNNQLTNLYWGSSKENKADRERHGTVPRGAKNGRTRLTENQVLAIRNDSRDNYIVAAEYGLYRSHITKIRLRHIWKHI